MQAHGSQDHDYRREIEERVNVQRVNQVFDVETFLAHIKNLQDEREDRDAEEHHRGEIAPERFEKQLRLRAALADLFLNSLLHPFFERRLGFMSVGAELHVRPVLRFLGNIFPNLFLDHLVDRSVQILGRTAGLRFCRRRRFRR